MLCESIYMRCPEQTGPQRVGCVCRVCPFAQAAINTGHRWGCLNNRNVLSQIWRPEVREQVSKELVSLRGPSPWLVNGPLSPPLCVYVLISSYNASLMGSGPSLVTSFYLFKGEFLAAP